MKHGGDHADLFFAAVETAMKKVMNHAKKRDLCPSCMLEAMAAFCMSNRLLQAGVVKDGKVVGDPERVLEHFTLTAMLMARALSEDGDNWEADGVDTRH